MSEVYDFAADPLNLPRWAAGLAGSKVERDGHQWFTEWPMGRVTFTFTPRNGFRVLDHDVTLPSGQTFSTRSGSSATATSAMWSSPSVNVPR